MSDEDGLGASRAALSDDKVKSLLQVANVLFNLNSFAVFIGR
jgi:hypothetical protein